MVTDWALAPLVKNLQAFRGVQLVTAAGLAAEVGDFHRFATAGKFMAFVGLVPSEHSTGTKAPNKIVTALARELAGFLWAAARLSTTPPGARLEHEAHRVNRPDKRHRKSPVKS